MKKLYVFDVDGTTVTTKTGQTFRQTADDWQFLPGVVEKCKQLRAAGAAIGLASNQNGVAFPWSRYNESQIQAEIDKTALELGASFVAICYKGPNEKCLPEYFHPNDPRRKPNPGMLLEILEAAKVSKEETLFVGDRDENEKAAINAGVAFAWAKDFFSEQTEGEQRFIIPTGWTMPGYQLDEIVYDLNDQMRGMAPIPGKIVGFVWRLGELFYLVNFDGYQMESDYHGINLTRDIWEVPAPVANVYAGSDDFDPFLDADDLP